MRILKYVSKRSRTTTSFDIVSWLASKGTIMSRSTLFRMFKRHGVFFGKAIKSNILFQEECNKRFVFAQEFVRKSPSWWKSLVYIDNKHFGVYLSSRDKLYSSKKQLKGVFRKKGEPYSFHSAQVNANFKYNTGAAPVIVSLAVSYRGVEACRFTTGRFRSANAISFYRKIALKRPRCSILEDNDPVFKSRVARRFKAINGLSVVAIPPKSPCLNPLDYSLWSFIGRKVSESNYRMRFQRETRVQYLQRLRNIILRTPIDVIRNSISNMPARVEMMRNSRGDIFRE